MSEQAVLLELPRRCSKCRELKKPSEFYRHYGKLRADCKKCGAKRHTAYVEKHQARIAKYRRSRNLRQFGISQETFDALLSAQGHACQICCRHIGSGERKFDRGYVDHDHETGAVRGILCVRCNLSIGQFDDNPRLLESAAAYLRKHGKV